MMHYFYKRGTTLGLFATDYVRVLNALLFSHDKLSSCTVKTRKKSFNVFAVSHIIELFSSIFCLVLVVISWNMQSINQETIHGSKDRKMTHSPIFSLLVL